jgi:peptidoglycan hydrolase-like protein with peptidoglycan-binding domain
MTLRAVCRTRRALCTAALTAGLLLSGIGPVEAAGTSSTTGIAAVARYPVLKYGSRGPFVRNLQARLHIYVDGWFGPQTRRAVKRFQAAKHLRVTGVVNAVTWRALPPLKRASRSSARIPVALARLNWRALARCESGGRTKAVNPRGFYGLYQFSLRTWRGVGGKGYPHWKSAAEQTYRAQLLYKRSGSRPWPHCGRLLYS